MVDIAVAGTLGASLALLAVGHFAGRRRYLVQSAGWAVMAGFWGIQTLVIELMGAGNVSNAFFTGMATIFGLYLSYYAFDAWDRGIDSRPLRFMAVMAVVSSAIYYPFEWSPELAGGLIYFVAVQTAWGLNAIGYSASAGSIVTLGGKTYVPIKGTNVSIILACTAVQAFAIFGGAIAATKAPMRLKAKALVYSVLPIHLLNILRNVGIIVLVESHDLDFEVAHSGYGKLFSLIALVVILYYLFMILPDLYDDIMGVMTLGDRDPKATAAGSGDTEEGPGDPSAMKDTWSNGSDEEGGGSGDGRGPGMSVDRPDTSDDTEVED